MKWPRRKRKDKKASRPARHMTICIWKLFKQLQVREKVIKANIWADCHRKETTFITIGILSFSLVASVLSSLAAIKKESDDKENFVSGIEDVQPLFQGLQQIQNSKDYQKEQISGFVLKGRILKNELDSLLRIRDKSHEDSLQIMIKYKQLEIITRNLKNE